MPGSLEMIYDKAKAFNGHGIMNDAGKLHHGLVFLPDFDYKRKKCRYLMNNLLKWKEEWLFKFVANPDKKCTIRIEASQDTNQ